MLQWILTKEGLWVEAVDPDQGAVGRGSLRWPERGKVTEKISVVQAWPWDFEFQDSKGQKPIAGAASAAMTIHH